MSHKLNDTWVFWYAPRGRKAKADAEHYDANLKELGECNTVEQFYSYYCFFKRPSEVKIRSTVRSISITRFSCSAKVEDRCGKTS
jgi:translation initiation factor 4E